ncbi:bacteriophage abortive infection AbiH family protein [Parabacteroides goldsteinii]|uniref:bacteriophage abortive infection AbiH family protein n=1 Tax=Parabacteroides goldsteinii TaxID=328812 RepID=UPI0020528D38|nr:MAG TPA: abortive infection protein [Caudoviricetes sp.]
MENLYLIGNGFDLHHEIPSSYRDYHKWLSKQQPDVADQLDQIYGTDDQWWCDFENSLGALEIETYIKGLNDLYPDILSEDHRDRDNYVMPDTAKSELITLYKNVRKSFYSWILSLPCGNSDKKLKIITTDAFFITFNYTETLQDLYNIPNDSILHLHGRASQHDDLILGHGRSYEEIKKSTTIDPPKELTDEGDIEDWFNGNYDPIIEETTKNVIDEVSQQMKDVKGIIAHNQIKINEVAKVSNIYAYGLSFSSVDLPYLDAIISKIDVSKVKWIISYYSGYDKQKIEQYMSSKGIGKQLYSLIKL